MTDPTIPVEVVGTVHVPGHGLELAGATTTVPDTPAVHELLEAGALKRKTTPTKKPKETQTGD